MNSQRSSCVLAPTLAALLVIAAANGYALNPVVQTIYTADPAPVVDGGICYLYTDHDEDVLVKNFFTMKIELHLDDGSGQLVGTLNVMPTGGADNWETQSCSVNGVQGVHDLVFKFTGGNAPLFDFDWWKFE